MEYSAEKLKVLKGLEAVRKRPGMYIGSTDSQGFHHLVWEIFDNSVDEALAGFANKIWLTIKLDGSIEVADNGRGIPVDKHQSGKTGVELVFSDLHAGGKFSSDVYKSAAGLHGVGSSVVNALSSKVEVWVFRNKKSYFTAFENGGYLTQPTKEIDKTQKQGTTVRFWPDLKIFGKQEFDANLIAQRLQETSFLISNLEIHFSDERSGLSQVFLNKKGLIDFIEHLAKGKNKIHEKPIFFKGKQQEIELEFAFLYVDDSDENTFSFANNVKTNQGGTHINGLKNALIRAFNDYSRQKNLVKNKVEFEYNDIKNGLCAVVSLRIPEPILEFVGQTKDKLSTSAAKVVTEEVIYSSLMSYLQQNKEISSKIITHINQSYQNRMEEKQAKIESKTSKSVSKEQKILSGKLTPAQSKKPFERELFLVEGESAGGSAKLGRNRLYQAILPLKGKIVNAEKTKLVDLLKNEEIVAIISALGTGIGTSFNIKNLNYHKIIIMTDADTDGAHIQILILTFFFRYFKSLIQNGHVYIAQPPLYKLTYKNKEEMYIWDEQKLAEFLNKKPGAQIQRYKGLGEMNAAQLWETTMDPQNRSLIRVTMADENIIKDRIYTLMGDRADIRKEWIEQNVDFSLEDSFIKQLGEEKPNYEK